MFEIKSVEQVKPKLLLILSPKLSILLAPIMNINSIPEKTWEALQGRAKADPNYPQRKSVLEEQCVECCVRAHSTEMTEAYRSRNSDFQGPPASAL